jgi:hypothetical protein
MKRESKFRSHQYEKLTIYFKTENIPGPGKDIVGKSSKARGRTPFIVHGHIGAKQ